MSKLIVVPTPIGNLEDMTFRAIRILKEADAVLAEDTRTTVKLFQKFEIENKLISHHLNNEHKTVDRIVNELESGLTYALVSDAGTPAISDPGFLLVRECVRRGIEVECLPGPTAFVPALVNSGFPCEKFVYEGFLPTKKGRQTRIMQIAEIDTATGKVLSYIYCQNLVTDASDVGNDVLNGIAHNPATGKTYVTGKLWPKLYEVKFE